MHFREAFLSCDSVHVLLTEPVECRVDVTQNRLFLEKWAQCRRGIGPIRLVVNVNKRNNVKLISASLLHCGFPLHTPALFSATLSFVLCNYIMSNYSMSKNTCWCQTSLGALSTDHYAHFSKNNSWRQQARFHPPAPIVCVWVCVLLWATACPFVCVYAVKN